MVYYRAYTVVVCLSVCHTPVLNQNLEASLSLRLTPSRSHTSLHLHRRLQWLQHVQHAQTQVSHLVSLLHGCRFFKTSKTSSGITDNLNACSTANRWHSTSDLSLLNTSVSLPPAVDLTYKTAVHWLPSRPHLPTSCQNVKTDATFPHCMTCFKSAISTPMPKAIVHTTTRMIESGLQNSKRMCLRSGSAMWAWYMDTMHFFGSMTPSLNALWPRKTIMRLYRSATILILWAKIRLLGHDCCFVITLFSNHSRSVSSVRQPLEMTFKKCLVGLEGQLWRLPLEAAVPPWRRRRCLEWLSPRAPRTDS